MGGLMRLMTVIALYFVLVLGVAGFALGFAGDSSLMFIPGILFVLFCIALLGIPFIITDTTRRVIAIPLSLALSYGLFSCAFPPVFAQYVIPESWEWPAGDRLLPVASPMYGLVLFIFGFVGCVFLTFIESDRTDEGGAPPLPFLPRRRLSRKKRKLLKKRA